MKLIRTEDAVGQVLCHDITQIIPGVVKDAVFRKGHIVTKEDIPVLLSVGKEHLYVWEKKEGILHEDEAAVILRDLCINDNMTASEPKEGKIEIRAAADGLLKINSEKLRAVNGLGEMMIATIHGNFPVKAGDRLAATRIIPLVIEEEKMNRAKEAAGGEPLLKILPMFHKKVGIVTTGSEIFKGRIQDAFGPAIRAKLAAYDTEVMGQVILDDCQEDISAAILKFARQGADMVLCTGGMSVDPDDRTPGAIKAAGADVVSYGAPVLPGNSVFFRIFLQSVMAAVIPVIHLIACHQCFDEDQPNPLFLTVLSEFIHIGKIQISGCLGIFLENRFPVLFSRTAVNRNKSPEIILFRFVTKSISVNSPLIMQDKHRQQHV